MSIYNTPSTEEGFVQPEQDDEKKKKRKIDFEPIGFEDDQGQEIKPEQKKIDFQAVGYETDAGQEVKPASSVPQNGPSRKSRTVQKVGQQPQAMSFEQAREKYNQSVPGSDEFKQMEEGFKKSLAPRDYDRVVKERRGEWKDEDEQRYQEGVKQDYLRDSKRLRDLRASGSKLSPEDEEREQGVSSFRQRIRENLSKNSEDFSTTYGKRPSEGLIGAEKSVVRLNNAEVDTRAVMPEADAAGNITGFSGSALFDADSLKGLKGKELREAGVRKYTGMLGFNDEEQATIVESAKLVLGSDRDLWVHLDTNTAIEDVEDLLDKGEYIPDGDRDFLKFQDRKALLSKLGLLSRIAKAETGSADPQKIKEYYDRLKSIEDEEDKAEAEKLKGISEEEGFFGKLYNGVESAFRSFLFDEDQVSELDYAKKILGDDTRAAGPSSQTDVDPTKIVEFKNPNTQKAIAQLLAVRNYEVSSKYEQVFLEASRRPDGRAMLLASPMLYFAAKQAVPDIDKYLPTPEKTGQAVGMMAPAFVPYVGLPFAMIQLESQMRNADPDAYNKILGVSLVTMGLGRTANVFRPQLGTAAVGATQFGLGGIQTGVNYSVNWSAYQNKDGSTNWGNLMQDLLVDVAQSGLDVGETVKGVKGKLNPEPNKMLNMVVRNSETGQYGMFVQNPDSRVLEFRTVEEGKVQAWREAQDEAKRQYIVQDLAPQTFDNLISTGKETIRQAFSNLLFGTTNPVRDRDAILTKSKRADVKSDVGKATFDREGAMSEAKSGYYAGQKINETEGRAISALKLLDEYKAPLNIHTNLMTPESVETVKALATQNYVRISQNGQVAITPEGSVYLGRLATATENFSKTIDDVSNLFGTGANFKLPEPSGEAPTGKNQGMGGIKLPPKRRINTGIEDILTMGEQDRRTLAVEIARGNATFDPETGRVRNTDFIEAYPPKRFNFGKDGEATSNTFKMGRDLAEGKIKIKVDDSPQTKAMKKQALAQFEELKALEGDEIDVAKYYQDKAAAKAKEADTMPTKNPSTWQKQANIPSPSVVKDTGKSTGKTEVGDFTFDTLKEGERLPDGPITVKESSGQMHTFHKDPKTGLYKVGKNESGVPAKSMEDLIRKGTYKLGRPAPKVQQADTPEVKIATARVTRNNAKYGEVVDQKTQDAYLLPKETHQKNYHAYNQKGKVQVDNRTELNLSEDRWGASAEASFEQSKSDPTRFYMNNRLLDAVRQIQRGIAFVNNSIDGITYNGLDTKRIHNNIAAVLARPDEAKSKALIGRLTPAELQTLADFRRALDNSVDKPIDILRVSTGSDRPDYFKFIGASAHEATHKHLLNTTGGAKLFSNPEVLEGIFSTGHGQRVALAMRDSEYSKLVTDDGRVVEGMEDFVAHEVLAFGTDAETVDILGIQTLDQVKDYAQVYLEVLSSLSDEYGAKATGKVLEYADPEVKNLVMAMIENYDKPGLQTGSRGPQGPTDAGQGGFAQASRRPDDGLGQGSGPKRLRLTRFTPTGRPFDLTGIGGAEKMGRMRDKALPTPNFYVQKPDGTFAFEPQFTNTKLLTFETEGDFNLVDIYTDPAARAVLLYKPFPEFQKWAEEKGFEGFFNSNPDVSDAFKYRIGLFDNEQTRSKLSPAPELAVASYSPRYEDTVLDRTKDGQWRAITTLPDGTKHISKLKKWIDPRTAKSIAMDSAFDAWNDKTRAAREAEGKSETGQVLTDINTPEFKKFFEGSKVVDKDGNPLKVSHGTYKSNGNFEVFRHEIPYSNDPSKMAKRPLWFTDSKDYIEDIGMRPNVRDFYLNIKNPLDMRELGEYATQKDIEAFYKKHGFDFKAAHDWEDGGQMPLYDEPKSATHIEALEKAGYDGYIISETGGATSYVAFRPNQIKAVDNRGTFDPGSDNVYHMASRSKEQEDLIKFGGDPQKMFFSAVTRAVEEANLPNKSTGQQYLNIIKGMKGVKAEELEWSGLGAFLEPSKKFTKEEVIAFTKEHEVQVEEVRFGLTQQENYERRHLINEMAGFEAKLREAESEYWRKNNRIGSREQAVNDSSDPTMKAYYAEYKALNERLGELNDIEDPRWTEYGNLVTEGERFDDVEIVLTVPNLVKGETAPITSRDLLESRYNPEVRKRERGPDYTSGHWDDINNAVVHIRGNGRKAVDGKQTFLIDEIQSDLHQEGRELGYITDEVKAEIKALEEEIKAQQAEIKNLETIQKTDTMLEGPGRMTDKQKRRLVELYDEDGPYHTNRDRLKKLRSANPEAPFKDSWYELAFKRALRWAVENGFDRIAWTTGQQQIDRNESSLRANVDKIEYYKNTPETRAILDGEFERLRKELDVAQATLAKETSRVSQEFYDNVASKVDTSRGQGFMSTAKSNYYSNDPAYSKAVETKNALYKEFQAISRLRNDIFGPVDLADSETLKSQVEADIEVQRAKLVEINTKIAAVNKKYQDMAKAVTPETAREFGANLAELTGRKNHEIQNLENEYGVERNKLVNLSSKLEDLNKYTGTVLKEGQVMIRGIKDGKVKINQTIPVEGETMIGNRRVTLEGLVGGKMAAEIRNNPTGKFEGEALSIGGGMHRLVYDTKLPSFSKKYVKQWGAEVGQTQIATSPYFVQKMSVAVGEKWVVRNRAGTNLGTFSTEAEGQAFVSTLGGEKFHSVDITGEMAESVMKGDQPLFVASRQQQTHDEMKTAYFTPPEKANVKQVETIVKKGFFSAFSSGDLDGLKKDLDSMGYYYIEVDGVYKGEAERSVIAYYPDQQTSRVIQHISNKHNQESVLHGAAGKYTLEFADGSRIETDKLDLTKTETVEKGIKFQQDYAKEKGIDVNVAARRYMTVPSQDLMSKLSKAHQETQHSPDDAATKKAYNALVKETSSQYKFIQKSGLEIEPWEGEGEPYKNSKEMIADIESGHYYYLKTDAAYGSGKEPDGIMLAPSKHKDSTGRDLLNNDVFRIVHDLMGHTGNKWQFGIRGEFNAFASHADLYSEAAFPALMSETLMQNAVVAEKNYTRNADTYKLTKGKEIEFADQKQIIPDKELVAEVKAALQEQAAKASDFSEDGTFIQLPDGQVKFTADFSKADLQPAPEGYSLDPAKVKFEQRQKHKGTSILTPEDIRRTYSEGFATDENGMILEPKKMDLTGALGLWQQLVTDMNPNMEKLVMPKRGADPQEVEIYYAKVAERVLAHIKGMLYQYSLTDPEAFGAKWYSEEANKFAERVGRDVKDVNNDVVKLWLFLMTAVTSRGTAVKPNARFAMNAIASIARFYESGKLTIPRFQYDNDGNVTISDDQPKRLGMSGQMMDKIELLTEGWVPVDSEEGRAAFERGAKIKRASELLDSPSMPKDAFVQSKTAKAMMEKYGSLNGVINFLISPSVGKKANKAVDVLGDKIGAFASNLMGITQIPTIDTWMHRYFLGLTGDLLTIERNKDGVVTKITDNSLKFNEKAGDFWRGVIQKATEDWNKNSDIKLTPADTQAIIWTQVKDLFNTLLTTEIENVDYVQAYDQIKAQMEGQGGLFTDSRRTPEMPSAESNPDLIKDASKKAPLVKALTEGTLNQGDRHFIEQRPGVELAVASKSGNEAKQEQIDASQAKLDAGDYEAWVDLASSLVTNGILSDGEVSKIKSMSAQGTGGKPDIEGLQKYVLGLNKQGVLELFVDFLRVNPLISVKNIVRNLSSNQLHQTADEISRLPAFVTDIGLAALSEDGKRQIQSPSAASVAKGVWKALTEGVPDAAKFLVKGDNAPNFEHPAMFRDRSTGWAILKPLEVYNKYGFRLQEAMDRPFKIQAKYRALDEIAKLKAKANKISVEEAYQHLTIEDHDQAWEKALYLTFQDSNSIAKMYYEVRDGQTPITRALMNFAVPYIKTPLNVVGVAMDYTGFFPLIKGLNKTFGHKEWSGFKNTVKEVLNNPEDRQAISWGLGKGMTGWTLAYIGWRLGAAGLLTSFFDREDKKDRDEMTAKGTSFGSIQIGDYSVDISSLTPVSFLLLSGAAYADAQKEAEKAAANGQEKSAGTMAVSRILKNLALQTPILSNIVRTYEDNEYREKGGKMDYSSLLGLNRVVPGFVQETAKTLDRKERVVNNESMLTKAKETIQSGIPVAREKLPVQYDMLGREIEAPYGADPFKTRKVKDDPVVKELDRFDITIGQDNKGTSVERNEKRGTKGRALEPHLQELIESEAYQKVPDATKKELIQSTIRVISRDLKADKLPEDAEKHNLKMLRERELFKQQLSENPHQFSKDRVVTDKRILTKLAQLNRKDLNWEEVANYVKSNPEFIDDKFQHHLSVKKDNTLAEASADYQRFSTDPELEVIYWYLSQKEYEERTERLKKRREELAKEGKTEAEVDTILSKESAKRGWANRRNKLEKLEMKAPQKLLDRGKPAEFPRPPMTDRQASEDLDRVTGTREADIDPTLSKKKMAYGQTENLVDFRPGTEYSKIARILFFSRDPDGGLFDIGTPQNKIDALYRKTIDELNPSKLTKAEKKELIDAAEAELAGVDGDETIPKDIKSKGTGLIKELIGKLRK
jgi:hypothetical protein